MRAFLVGPVDYLDRRVGLVAGLVQGSHRLERAEHAEHAVELAAGRLRVEVRAHRDRRQLVILARPTRKHVADFVDRHRAAERLAPLPEPLAHLAVEVGQRQTANAALGRGAKLRCFHQRVPKALGVNLQVLHGLLA
jgi:hypothetical protein